MPQVQGSSPAAARERMLAAARAHFRPEFLNRLDAIVAFEPLSPTQLVGVARLMAAELGERLAPKNISLRVTEAALKLAVQQAYDPVYGARPIRRWLVSARSREEVSASLGAKRMCARLVVEDIAVCYI